MSERIMTLFGEEIIPEQLKAVGKSRARKKTDEQEPQDDTADTSEEIIQEDSPQAADSLPVDAEPVATLSEPQAAEGTDAPAAADKPAETPVQPAKAAKKKTQEEHIILPEDWQGDKTYYSIGEVADLFKVKTSHIRFWTNEFKLKVRTNRKGDRLFTPGQIRELRTIHHLVKERGFTLTGAKAKLSEPGGLDVQTMDLKQSLLQLRNKLVIIKNQLM